MRAALVGERTGSLKGYGRCDGEVVVQCPDALLDRSPVTDTGPRSCRFVALTGDPPRVCERTLAAYAEDDH